MGLRRLASVICLGSLLLSCTAQAGSYDIMVIRPKIQSITTVQLREVQTIYDQNFQTLTDILNLVGANYSVYTSREAAPNSRAVSEYIRTGIFARNTGLADTAACVIISSFIPASLSGAVIDSLTRIARGGPLVPICYLLDSAVEASNLGGSPYMDDAGSASVRDSAGVSGVKANPSPAGAPVLANGSRASWVQSVYSSGYVRNASQAPAGGLRPLLYASTTGEGLVLPFLQQNSVWVDSLPFLNTQAADTLLVWDRLWNIATLPTAKPMTFISWGGAGLSSGDSLSAANSTERPSAEGALDILMYGLAHFDSLTGGKVFGRMKRPLQLAITVDGALTRNDRKRVPGIVNADTTAYYATLDSVAALGIPITFGVNVDSAASYGRDIIKLKSISQARFTPQSWKGQQRGASGDTTNGAGSGNASKNNIVDPFGRYRLRAFVGDTAAVADSSVYGLLLRARMRCDSIFGSDRGSLTLLAPYDDYSPKNMLALSSTPDSLISAFVAAGFQAVRSNNRWSNSFPGIGTEGKLNPRGWFTSQKTLRNPLYPTTGQPVFKVVCDGGYPLWGGYRQGKHLDDSTTVPPSQIGHVERMRVLGEMLVGKRYDFDIWGNYGSIVGAGIYAWRDINQHTEDFQAPGMGTSLSSSSYIGGRGNVMMLHASDFSGRTSDPARVGWWHMKHLVVMMRACNQAAGRSIFTFCYPEEITP